MEQPAPIDFRAELERLRAADFSDSDLAAAIERLLEAHRTSLPLQSWLQSIAFDESALRAPIADHESQIGPYQILEVLGEGGMGTVYLAEQREPVRRRVALKVIKAGMDSRAVLARFAAERQTLSIMEHSSVARIFDAGITRTGRPYFAMEYIKGVPLTQYCDQNRLSLEARIGLFRNVCAGVQHAHLKGVMHRDLTPNNVLVTVQDGSPVPKIIDFGLAKAIDHRLVDATLFTAHGQILGTPEYMSPEQAGLGGLDVDTRTDVYSLGVMLYELLTGSLPFDRKDLVQRGYSEMQRLLRETDPPRPSTRLTSMGDNAAESARRRSIDLPELRSRLRGDLDWIVMKALEKDRTRRYQTAMELAADLERYVQNLPVLASPPSVAYRVRKYVRRHRPTVVAAALATFALLGGSGAAVMGLVEARAKTEQVSEQKARADKTAEELQRVVARYRLREALTIAEQLMASEGELFPAVPDKAQELRDWLDECDKLLAEHIEFEQTLTEMSAAATSDKQQKQLRALAPLGQRFDQLKKSREIVTERLAWASRLEERTLRGGRVTWSAAQQAIASNVHYREHPIQDLRPQLGLVPLGENPATGLWEFYDLRSAAMPSQDDGMPALPTIDAKSGAIHLGAEHGVVYVLLPGGSFSMGVEGGEELAYESPPVDATIEPFLLSRFELTQSQWCRWSSGPNPSTFNPLTNPAESSEEHPVETVTWYECDLVLRHNLAVLPTEAQWEWACHAGTTSRWWTGDTPATLAGAANVFDKTGAKTWSGNPAPFDDGYRIHAPVGSFRGNAFGLHDMHGNVWEWCRDTLWPYDQDVEPRSGDGLRERPVPLEPLRMMLRGGAFSGSVEVSRSTYRAIKHPSLKDNVIGVRPARMLTR